MEMIPLNAILLPSDGRPPSIVELMLSANSSVVDPSNSSYASPPAFMPHPEVFMDYIAEIGFRAWEYHLVEALDQMIKKFANPYIIFYPVVSRDGMPFPVNKCVKDIQGKAFKEEVAWRGNMVIAKYRDAPFTSMMDASMADFPILKNYLLTHGCPRPV